MSRPLNKSLSGFLYVLQRFGCRICKHRFAGDLLSIGQTPLAQAQANFF